MGIAADMRSTQSAVQQKAKSRRSEGGSQSGFDQVAYLHAEERLAHGFGINDVVAEFRALRGGDLDFRAILRLERLRLLAA
ncbi:hypothetical protein V4C53_43690 [Paraburkholderia azotifigens]|uniref:hypothetical protein n=1 Tax=Paraburkholderia azotifigens TaxID=2057004 RepID=UPI00317D0F57